MSVVIIGGNERMEHTSRSAKNTNARRRYLQECPEI